MEIITDQDMIAGCIAGDKEIRDAFVRRFSDFVFRTVQYAFKSKNIPCSQMEIEDVHSTVFVKIFEKRCKKLAQYKGKNGCSLMSWMRLITVRTVLDHIRMSSNALTYQKEVVPIEVLDDLEEKGDNPHEYLEKAEQIKLIQKCMKDMPQREQLFLKLHFFQGISISETADIIGISSSNAHIIKHRVIKKLKHDIGQLMKN